MSRWTCVFPSFHSPPRKRRVKILFFFIFATNQKKKTKEEKKSRLSSSDEKGLLCDFSQTRDIILSLSIYRNFTFWVIKWLIIVTPKKTRSLSLQVPQRWRHSQPTSETIMPLAADVKSQMSKVENEKLRKKLFTDVFVCEKWKFFGRHERKGESRSFFTFPTHIAWTTQHFSERFVLLSSRSRTTESV